MPEYYLVAVPGETRAAITDNGRLTGMRIQRDGDGLQAGARVQARLKAKLGGRGIAQAGAEELLIEPWPTGATEGANVTAEIARAAWSEHGRDRLAKARPTSLPAAEAPTLAAMLRGQGAVPKPGWPEAIDEQWHDAFEQAELGCFRFPGGTLQLSPTPAFLAVDVDGAAADIAVPALRALAQAIRLWDLGGNIVVDLPGTGTRAERTAAAQALDSAMRGLAFERSAINGFGLLQLVCPRRGPSVLERARLDRAGTAAIRLLETALRDPGTGPMLLKAPKQVAGWIASRPHLIDEVRQRTRRALDVLADPLLEAGHVETASNR